VTLAWLPFPRNGSVRKAAVMLFAAGDVATSGDHLFYLSLLLVLGWFVMSLGLMLAGWTGHGSARTIGLAGLFGLAGLVGGTLAAGGGGPVAIVDSITFGCIVAGIAWVAGSAVGLGSWIEIRPVSTAEIRALVGGAVVMLLLASVLTQWVFVPAYIGIDEHEQLIPTSPRLVLIQRTLSALITLRRVIWADAAIAAATFLIVLRVRSGRARRSVDARSASASSVAGSSPNPSGGDSSG
jgi:hypothetical protein